MLYFQLIHSVRQIVQSIPVKYLLRGLNGRFHGAAYQAGVSVGRERAEARELEEGETDEDVTPAATSRGSRGTRRQSRGAGEASGT